MNAMLRIGRVGFRLSIGHEADIDAQVRLWFVAFVGRRRIYLRWYRTGVAAALGLPYGVEWGVDHGK